MVLKILWIPPREFLRNSLRNSCWTRSRMEVRNAVYLNVFSFPYLFVRTNWLHVCLCNTSVPGACGGHQIPWNLSCGWLLASMWVLGTKPGSFWKVTNVLNWPSFLLGCIHFHCRRENKAEASMVRDSEELWGHTVLPPPRFPLGVFVFVAKKNQVM